MARSRMIKPEFWRSPHLSQVGYFSRLLFIGLWQVADDQGNGPGDVILIATELFPHDFARDTQGVLSECSHAMRELSESGLIQLYRVDGRDYYTVPKFLEHQTINRPSAPKYPAPSMSDSTPPPAPAGEDSVSSHDRLNLKGREEKRSEGEGEGEQNVATSDEADDGAAKPDPNDRDDVHELLDHLDAKIREVDPEAKLPSRTKANADAARLLIDKDGRTVEQVKAAASWALDTEFWRPNIRSMSKLREKYDQLRAQAQRDQSRPQGAGQYTSASDRRLQAGAERLQRRAQKQAGGLNSTLLSITEGKVLE